MRKVCRQSICEILFNGGINNSKNVLKYLKVQHFAAANLQMCRFTKNVTKRKEKMLADTHIHCGQKFNFKFAFHYDFGDDFQKGNAST